MGEPRLLDWSDGRGTRRLAAVLAPASDGRDSPPPAIVCVYGGAWQASEINDFGCGHAGASSPLMLTSRGYTVILPDMGLQTGEPADELADLAGRALDVAAAAGLADPNRAGLLGHSYGGYGVCAIVTRTGRFRAAVASAAITDLAAWALQLTGNQLAGFGEAVHGLGGMRVPPWEDPARYARNSPIYGVGHVTTPVLLFHGTEDPGPISQSEAFYAGLLQQGRTAALVRLHGEGHGPRDWAPETIADYWRRTLEWFDRYLRQW